MRERLDTVLEPLDRTVLRAEQASDGANARGGERLPAGDRVYDARRLKRPRRQFDQFIAFVARQKAFQQYPLRTTRCRVPVRYDPCAVAVREGHGAFVEIDARDD